MEKIKNICCDLGRAFTIGLLSGGAAAAVLLLGGFLFGGFTFRAALEAAKDGESHGSPGSGLRSSGG